MRGGSLRNDANVLAITGVEADYDAGQMTFDDALDLRRPAHTILLGSGIPVVEHLTNLAALPATDFRFFAVPPKVRSFGTFPVRAFALV